MLTIIYPSKYSLKEIPMPQIGIYLTLAIMKSVRMKDLEKK